MDNERSISAFSGTYVRPWFTTAAGMYVHGVNEALLSGDETGLRIGFGLDESVTDFRFRLAAHGGFVLECTVRSCQLESLAVYGTSFCRTKSVRVTLPDRLGGSAWQRYLPPSDYITIGSKPPFLMRCFLRKGGFFVPVAKIAYFLKRL